MEGALSGWRALESVIEESQSRRSGMGGLQWGRGHCRHRGWFWGGFLAGEQRGAAQAATADLRHGEADERTGWKQGFAHFWCLSKVH